MHRLALCLLVAACSTTGRNATSGPEASGVTEVIVTAGGTVECAGDGEIRASDLRGC